MGYSIQQYMTRAASSFRISRCSDIGQRASSFRIGKICFRVGRTKSSLGIGKTKGTFGIGRSTFGLGKSSGIFKSFRIVLLEVRGSVRVFG